jgi:Zn-dependent membrane protease YugP
MFWYIDPLYLTIFVITLIISIGAQVFVRSTYKKWGKVRNSTGLTGAQVGDQIIRRTGLGAGGYFPATEPTPSYGIRSGEVKKLADLRQKGIISDQEYDVKVKQIQIEVSSQESSGSSIRFTTVPGELTDHYDPRNHTVRMSEVVAKTPSVSSMAIVAHELGHAQQHEDRSLLIQIRNVFVPAVTFSPTIAYFCIFLGLVFNFVGLIYIGILFYGLMVLFTLITLPVEIDASRRGIKLLSQSGLMQTSTDEKGSKSVLTAAAMTYVAAAVTAILQLLYYISIGRRRR